MTVLDEYLGFFEKLDKRVRNERVTELIPKLDLAKRADFEGDKKTPSKKIERLEKELKKLQKDEGFKSVESRFDEEHNLWEVSFVNKHGAEHVINWVLASSAECRQLISKYKQIEPYMEPPFVVETLAKAAPASNGDGVDAEAGRRREEREEGGEAGGQAQDRDRSGGEDERPRPARLCHQRRAQGLHHPALQGTR